REMLVGRAGLAEIEDTVDHGLEPADLDRPVHGLEHVAAAHLYAAHGRALGEERRRVDRRLAGEGADDAHVTAIAQRRDRAGDRARAADIHHDVRAAPGGQLAHPRVPRGLRARVDDVGYAELLQ